MNPIRHIIDAAKGKHPITHTRSSHWPKVRREHLRKHPHCAICDTDKHLQVHHIVPFHINPNLELDPNNLVTLCEPPGKTRKCHLCFGHIFDWHLYNPEVNDDIKEWNKKLAEAKKRYYG